MEKRALSSILAVLSLVPFLCNGMDQINRTLEECPVIDSATATRLYHFIVRDDTRNSETFIALLKGGDAINTYW